VEEEIPPNWEEILPNSLKTTSEQRSATGTITPLMFLEPAEIGCMVEEEVPLQETLSCYYPGKNFFVAKDEYPGINWDECWNEDDAEEHAHLDPTSCRFTEDDLVLIFDMHKDLEEQLHNQHTSASAWTSCTTPCQVSL
jgi:hypothetical protein